jgi:serine/threonine protein kinase
MMATQTGSAKPRGLLSLDIELINNSEDENEMSYRLNETAYRQDGISIGRDYLRMEGVTVTRGELVPDKLTVQDVIGRGAFSTVRRALWKRGGGEQQQQPQQIVEVAIKDCSILDASRQRREMLLKELRAMYKLTSPSLVRLYGAFLQPDSDSVSIVLEFMDRGSLEDILNRRQSGFPDSIAAAIIYQIICGLSYLHAPERRIIHRDLKPANVLLNSKGCVKLCDFGLATLLGEESLNMTVLGTTKFMAPERLRAQPYGRSSDIWSLGLVSLECVSGKAPFSDVHSMVELLITIEETLSSDLIGCANNPHLQEILVGCLKVQPGMTTVVLNFDLLVACKHKNRTYHAFACALQTHEFQPKFYFILLGFQKSIQLGIANNL